MVRKCKKIALSKDRKKGIYIDSLNKEEIMTYINSDERHTDKFRFFRDIFLDGLRNSFIYRKENISRKCKDVYAIRFFPGQENDRIYCKEINNENGTRIVVMAILHLSKKSKGLSSKEISEIEKVGGYIYEFE